MAGLLGERLHVLDRAGIGRPDLAAPGPMRDRSAPSSSSGSAAGTTVPWHPAPCRNPFPFLLESGLRQCRAASGSGDPPILPAAAPPRLQHRRRGAGDGHRKGVPTPPADRVAMRAYRLSEFDFALPQELIAQTPSPTRAASRMLHVDAPRSPISRSPTCRGSWPPATCVVFNDTRVIKSRLHAVKPTGGAVELLARARARPARGGVPAPREPPAAPRRHDRPARRCDGDGGRARRPLLPAAHRRRAVAGSTISTATARSRCRRTSRATPTPTDETRYQTVYARHAGAVAAPTAGLHFDDAMLAALRAAGIAVAWVTLHVGAGTFAPVQTDDLAAHRMHSEWYRIPPATAAAVAAARARGGRVIAVGTTTLRALESAANEHGDDRDRRGRDRAVRHAGIPLSRRRPAADELPSAEVDAAGARVRVRRPRGHPRCLRARDRPEIPFLQLRRRDAGRARTGLTW